MERVTGLEPATVCLEGRNSSQLSYTRIFIIAIWVYIFIFSFQENFNLGVAGFEPATLWYGTLKWPNKIQILPICNYLHLSLMVLYKNQSQIQPLFLNQILSIEN